MKFIHAADIHLDSPLRGLRVYEGAPEERLRRATRRALENLVQLAIDEEAAFVLIAGDVYDGDWPDYGTGLFFCDQMSRLRAHDIPVFLISGNHDAQSRITKSLTLPANVHRFDSRRASTQTLDDLGVAVHGQSFARAEVTDNLARNFPAQVPGLRNIGLLHTALDGREGHAPYAPCVLDDLHRLDYDYWALGHVHTRETLCDAPVVAFPGNVQGRHVREQGARGCLLVTMEGDSVTTEFRALDVVRWTHCQIDAGAGTESEALDGFMDAITALLGENDLLNAVRVSVRTERGLDRARLDAEIRNRANDAGGDCLWVEKVLCITATREGDALSTAGFPEIARLLEELRSAPDALPEFAKDIEDLVGRLPVDLRGRPEVKRWLDAEGSVELLTQASALLMARMREGGAE